MAAPALIPGGDRTHEARHPGAVAELHPVRLPRQVRGGLPLPRQQELVRAATAHHTALIQAPLVCVYLEHLPRLPTCSGAALRQRATAQVDMSVERRTTSYAVCVDAGARNFAPAGRRAPSATRAATARRPPRAAPPSAAPASPLVRCDSQAWPNQPICHLLAETRAMARSQP